MWQSFQQTKVSIDRLGDILNEANEAAVFFDLDGKKLEVLNKLNYFAIKHQISYHKEIEAELIRAFDPYFAPQPRNGLGMLWTVDRFQDLNLREEYPIHWDFRKDKQHPRLREIENRVSCSFS